MASAKAFSKKSVVLFHLGFEALALQGFYFFFDCIHGLGGRGLSAGGNAAEKQQRGKKQQVFHNEHVEF